MLLLFQISRVTIIFSYPKRHIFLTCCNQQTLYFTCQESLGKTFQDRRLAPITLKPEYRGEIREWQAVKLLHLIIGPMHLNHLMQASAENKVMPEMGSITFATVKN